MVDSADLDLRGHLASLLSGTMPLASFRHWFANALWSLEEAADDDTLDFAYLVENRLAEYSGGHITDDELLSVLRRDFVALGPGLSVVRGDRRLVSGSTSTVIDRRPPSSLGQRATAGWLGTTLSRLMVPPVATAPGRRVGVGYG